MLSTARRFASTTTEHSRGRDSSAAISRASPSDRRCRVRELSCLSFFTRRQGLDVATPASAARVKILDRAASSRLTVAGCLSVSRFKRFFRKALNETQNPHPRVINVDKNPAYPAAVEALKEVGTLHRRCRLRQCKYLNNVVEQDHRTVKQRVWLAKGYGSFRTVWRTLRGIEAVSMTAKGRARRVAKGDAVAQARLINKVFGLAA